MSRPNQRTVYFCYADPVGFSGQKAAMELVMGGLAERGWAVRKLPLPVLDRHAPKWTSIAAYAFHLVGAWVRSLRLAVAGDAWLCVAVGQTRASFVRDLVPVLLGRIFLGRSRILFPLHSSLFLTWPEDSLDLRLFLHLVHQAGCVAVLGERQRDRLLALGLPRERVQVLVNTCALEPLDAAAVAAKLAGGAGRIPRVLYLSSLVDTKGYPEFLEALEILSARPEAAFEAVLCGPLAASEFAERFGDPVAAAAWIEARVDSINRGAPGRARWIRGATGDAKAALFRAADIFVLPSRYVVEAQPIVLLEAMASGCAIVTSAVGEIPTILGPESAWFVAPPFVEPLTEALGRLLLAPEVRAELAGAAHERFVARYGRPRHLDRWEAMLAADASNA